MTKSHPVDAALAELDGVRTLNIFQRLHAVMEEVDYIQKEKKSEMKYSIVTHDAVTAKVRPLMVKHRVIYYPVRCTLTQNGNRTEGAMTVRFQNIDDGGDWMDVETGGFGIDAQDKGPGKAISYGVKYALLKALGLESGDDPDTDQVTEHEPLEFAALKTAMEMCQDLDQLKAQVPQLQKLGPSLTPAKQAQLRTVYAQMQKKLTPSAGDA